MVPYISYTAHFIDSSWELRSRCFTNTILTSRSYRENIADALESTLESWNLAQNKQVCLTTDSGSNIINATRQLKWTRLACFGHNLHLAITKSIKDDRRCSRVSGVCHKLVSAFSQSWKRKRDFKKAQIHLELKQHSLVMVSAN